MPDHAQIPVVIVGAGPVGLALAIELGTRNVGCILLERNARDGWSPRAKTTHTRTRGFMRRWGIADELAAAAPFGIDYPSNIHFVTRLSGHRLTRFDDALDCRPVQDERYPEHSQWIPQYKLEEILRKKVQQLDCVEFRPGSEVIDVEQSKDGVSIRTRRVETNEEETIEAQYVVGADGARSTVREKMGAKMVGAPALARHHNIIFHAPGLAEAHSHGPGVLYWLINPEIPGILGNMDKGDLWVFGPAAPPRGEPMTDEEVVEMLKRAIGFDLPYKVIKHDFWVASRLFGLFNPNVRRCLDGDRSRVEADFIGVGRDM